MCLAAWWWLGVGVSANDALAREAGLATDRGVVVDACARTADPLIVAAGDCTARRLADGSLLRLESVQNATEQAKSAAAALLGQDRPFTATPWFWSDQYDKKLQMAGLSGGADAWAVRGPTWPGSSFSVYHFRDGALIAGDSVNAAKDHLQSAQAAGGGRVAHASPGGGCVVRFGWPAHAGRLTTASRPGSALRKTRLPPCA